jgi:hypothetical protein
VSKLPKTPFDANFYPLRKTDTTLWSCTHCHGLMHLVEPLSAAQLFFTERKEFHALDSS